MNAQTLPLPNPGDWVTVEGAAMIVKRSKSQVIRYMADQRLASYRIYGSRDRLAERLIWRADAEAFRDAMKTVSRPGILTQIERRRASERRRG